MQQRGCGLGCTNAALGLALSCCLLPYLISSIYSIVSQVLQVPGTPEWLWGSWLSTFVAADSPLYMFLAEGPICCVGLFGLLILIFGIVLMAIDTGREDTDYEDDYALDMDHGVDVSSR